MVQSGRETSLGLLGGQPGLEDLGHLLEDEEEGEEGPEAAGLQDQAGVARLPLDELGVDQVADRILQHDGQHEDQTGEDQIDDPLGETYMVALVGLPGDVENDENN